MVTALVAMEIVMCERSVSRTQTEGSVRIALCPLMTCLTGKPLKLPKSCSSQKIKHYIKATRNFRNSVLCL